MRKHLAAVLVICALAAGAVGSVLVSPAEAGGGGWCGEKCY
jgi:hypothetical protein